ncbi:alpha/beta hydrolase [Curtobacterium sp. MCBA15_012]|uniref:alpha/beta hydrolase n=1 Tax=Curtobacterium sp. MCBA15_012 TaxID=1898738 RepID=UPI0008DE8486|nr:alpha/beta hydrolase [Curtobacterium sp. MCBA15_012]WIB00306.1 alpha/beta hydrolase [Curtobacterium sp. MCBA15_012]
MPVSQRPIECPIQPAESSVLLGFVPNLLDDICRHGQRSGDAAQRVQHVGGRLGTTFSHSDGLALWEKAPNAKNFHVIDGAGHYEMYDEPKYVNEAVETLDVFFREHLAS